MEYTLDEPLEGGGARLHLRGEVTIEAAESLKALLLDALETTSELVVDCTGASALDLSTLQLLCAAHRTAQSLGKSMILEGQTEEVVARVILQAGFPRQRACLLSPDPKTCLWVRRAALQSDSCS